MKKTKVTRLLALALGFAMVFSTAACGSSNEPAPEVEQEASGQEAAGNQEADSPEAEEVGNEPITLTLGVASTNFSDGIHTDEYPVLQKIQEETGITLDLVCYDTEKFSLLASGGDLPDIVSLNNENNIVASLISSGQLIPLNDLLDEYGENIKENIPYAIEQAKYQYGNGETVYYLAQGVASLGTTPRKNGYVGLRARYDIYKACGAPEITNEDEYLQALKEMQDYQREQTGDDSIYALSSYSDSGMWPYAISYPFSHGLMNMNINASFSMETGEAQSNFLEKDSVFMDGIRFFNKAYKLGILDPDGFVQKYTQYEEKVRNGKVLVSVDWAEPDPALCGEDAICVFLPGLPYISGVYRTPYPYGSTTSSARAISSNCEYPERAMQLLNWLDSEEGMRTIENGIQGVEWDYVDGVPQIIGDYLNAYKDGRASEYMEERKVGPYNPLSCYYSGEVTTEDGYPVDLASSEAFLSEFSTEAEKKFAQDYDPSFTYPGQVYDLWVKEGIVATDTTEVGMLKNLLAPSVSDENIQREAEASNYFMSNVSKLIMAETEEEFDQELDVMIAKFKEIGLDKSWEEYQQNYAEGLKIYDEMFGE